MTWPKHVEVVCEHGMGYSQALAMRRDAKESSGETRPVLHIASLSSAGKAFILLLLEDMICRVPAWQAGQGRPCSNDSTIEAAARVRC